jgi:RNA polymerase-associated protein CTR9/transcription factor SPN1
MAKDDNTHQRGAVKDPEHDGRLKENREEGTSKGASQHSGGSHSSSQGSHGSAHGSHGSSHESSGHTPGAVKDPEHDGRLKENRDKGIHKGDA